jgi:hypothetical protein
MTATIMHADTVLPRSHLPRSDCSGGYAQVASARSVLVMERFADVRPVRPLTS